MWKCVSFERYLFEIVYLGHESSRTEPIYIWVGRRLKIRKYEVQDSHVQRNQAYLFILTVSMSSIMQLELFSCFTLVCIFLVLNVVFLLFNCTYCLVQYKQ